VLGASLVGQGHYAEAEPILIGGYQGMLQRQAPDPTDQRSASRQAAEWVYQLYQRWGKSAKAAHWLDEAHAITKDRIPEP
jgi:eukaryotic-like serine/threonine-protein kinase